MLRAINDLLKVFKNFFDYAPHFIQELASALSACFKEKLVLHQYKERPPAQ